MSRRRLGRSRGACRCCWSCGTPGPWFLVFPTKGHAVGSGVLCPWGPSEAGAPGASSPRISLRRRVQPHRSQRPRNPARLTLPPSRSFGSPFFLALVAWRHSLRVTAQSPLIFGSFDNPLVKKAPSVSVPASCPPRCPGSGRSPSRSMTCRRTGAACAMPRVSPTLRKLRETP